MIWVTLWDSVRAFALIVGSVSLVLSFGVFAVCVWAHAEQKSWERRYMREQMAERKRNEEWAEKRLRRQEAEDRAAIELLIHETQSEAA